MSDLNAIIDLKTNDNVKNVRGRRKKGIGERKQCMDIERKKGKKKEGKEDKRKGKKSRKKGKRKGRWNLPGSPVVKTLCFHCRGHRVNLRFFLLCKKKKKKRKRGRIPFCFYLLCHIFTNKV